ncbi:MAG: HD domain-containing protein [Lachnospiraceae bacterium]|nr:HD domain-containing protein [Lachnospiraceae bacterium]
MDKTLYKQLENHMLLCMDDSAHGKDHVYRVLYQALDIAQHESGVDLDVLIAACLLHDIGRKEQFENPALCHARVGSKKAYAYLLSIGFDEEKAAHVRDCILTHRYRSDAPPKSIEAKILFDADKLDVTGTVGIARTIMYKAQVGEPLYTMCPDGTVADGSGEEPPSFFQEYHYKLKNLYDKFYTERGHDIAVMREKSAQAFYHDMLQEVSGPCKNGTAVLEKLLEPS